MMSKRILANVVCCSLLAVLPASAAVTTSVWTAVAASRGVEARPATAATADDWRDVRRGDELASKTSVRTGRRGRATLTRLASVLIVDPGSQIELPEPGSGGVESGLVEVLNPANGESTDLGPGQSVFLDREEQRLDHVDLREAQPPRARAEVKRLVQMERREERRLQRETSVDDAHGRNEALDGGSLDRVELDGARTGVVGADPVDLPELPEDGPTGSGKPGGTEKVDPVD